MIAKIIAIIICAIYFFKDLPMAGQSTPRSLGGYAYIVTLIIELLLLSS